MNVCFSTILQPFWRFVRGILHIVLLKSAILSRPFGLNVFNILNYGILQRPVIGSSAQHVVSKVMSTS